MGANKMKRETEKYFITLVVTIIISVLITFILLVTVNLIELSNVEMSLLTDISSVIIAVIVSIVAIFAYYASWQTIQEMRNDRNYYHYAAQLEKFYMILLANKGTIQELKKVWMWYPSSEVHVNLSDVSPEFFVANKARVDERDELRKDIRALNNASYLASNVTKEYYNKWATITEIMLWSGSSTNDIQTVQQNPDYMNYEEITKHLFELIDNDIKEILNRIEQVNRN